MSDVLITRLFDAPRELVFQAWVDPEQLKQWHAPQGCSINFVKADIRTGGSFHSCIHNPHHGDCWCIGHYKAVIAPERIVYTMAIADKHGNLRTPAEAGMDADWPAETTVTLTFEEINGKTKLTLHQTVSEELAKQTGAHPSWIQMLDNLENLLA